MTHPFIERVRAERSVIATVNYAAPPNARQLSGLGSTEIVKWSENLDGTLPKRTVTRIRRAVIDLALRIRSSSSNSHRGGAWISDDDRGDLQGDLAWLRGLFVTGTARRL